MPSALTQGPCLPEAEVDLMWLAEVGEYRLQRVLSQLDSMATLSPRSALLSTTPLDYLPTTRFLHPEEAYCEQMQEAAVEMQKERDGILSQPYRTTPLITPGAKARPHLINNKLSLKPLHPTLSRPIDPKNLVAQLDEKRALVNRQFNSPQALYSGHNVGEAIYAQTGVHLTPLPPKHFDPDASPTFQALLAEERRGQGGRFLPPPNVQHNFPPHKAPHSTAPTSYINSVGQPSSRIAQSGSFRRLMMSVMLGE